MSATFSYIYNEQSGEDIRGNLNSWRDHIIENATNIAGATAGIAALTATLANYQPLDSDLTTIAALTPSNGDILYRATGAWVNRTTGAYKTALNLVQADVSGLVAALAAKQDKDARDTTNWLVKASNATGAALLDTDKNTQYSMTVSATGTFTIPPDVTNPNLPIGTNIAVYNLNASGANDVVLTPGAGVTILYANSLTNTINSDEYAVLRKVDSNTWLRFI